MIALSFSLCSQIWDCLLCTLPGIVELKLFPMHSIFCLLTLAQATLASRLRQAALQDTLSSPHGSMTICKSGSRVAHSTTICRRLVFFLIN